MDLLIILTFSGKIFLHFCTILMRMIGAGTSVLTRLNFIFCRFASTVGGFWQMFYNIHAQGWIKITKANVRNKILHGKNTSIEKKKNYNNVTTSKKPICWCTFRSSFFFLSISFFLSLSISPPSQPSTHRLFRISS